MNPFSLENAPKLFVVQGHLGVVFSAKFCGWELFRRGSPRSPKEVNLPLITLTLRAAKDLHQENGKALIMFESPKHNSFKSNAQVPAMLQIEGFWLVEIDYCALAEEALDGAAHGLANNRRGGVQVKQGTVVLVAGLRDDPQKEM